MAENTVTNTKKPRTKKEKVLDALSWLSLISMVILLAVVCNRVYIMRTTGEQAFILGYRPAVVLTGSMEPHMLTHSLCLNREIKSPDEIEIGDVVTYEINTEEGKPILVTHRVVAFEDGLYYFKGDNNNVVDGYGLPFESLVSEVVFIWNGGAKVVDLILWFADQFKTDNIGKFICFSAAVGVVCAYHLVCVIFEMAWGFIFHRKKKDPEQLEDTSAIEAEAVVSDNSTDLPSSTSDREAT